MKFMVKALAMLLCMCAFLTTRASYGQIAVVERSGVTIVRSLSGRVDIGVMQVPAKDATVELCTGDWKTVISSSKTDSDGTFSLGKVPGKLFYIRLSAPGTNPYQLRVRVDKHARHDLTIHLIIAT